MRLECISGVFELTYFMYYDNNKLLLINFICWRLFAAVNYQGIWCVKLIGFALLLLLVCTVCCLSDFIGWRQRCQQYKSVDGVKISSSGEREYRWLLTLFMLLVDASSLLHVSDRELCVIMVQSQVHTAWRQVTIAIPKTSYMIYLLKSIHFVCYRY